jgi:3-oxoacyl-[acyl-carrier protein] reductase
VTGAFGRLDVLVNNAGIIHRATLLDAVEAELDAMYAINVKGTWHMIRAAAPALKARGTGRIVNIASLAALGTAISGTSPYAATKAAVIALTKRAALELGRDGITVNAICPGFILTDMLAATAPGGGGNLAALADKTMVGRVGRPEDVAEAALYLAGDEAGFVTAQVLTVDGGRLDFLTHSA